MGGTIKEVKKYSRLETTKYKYKKHYRRNCRKCGKACCGRLCLACYYSKTGRGSLSRRGRYNRNRERDKKVNLERYHKKKKDGSSK